MAETKKKTKSVRKKQCSTKGCRKARVDGSEFCRDCAPAAPVEENALEPEKSVLKLSELDLLKFLRTDTELHNHRLEIKNLEQEQVIEDREFDQRRATRTNRIKLLQQSIRQRQVEQKTLLMELGARYGFDATVASIDDQTGIIHEHPPKGT